MDARVSHQLAKHVREIFFGGNWTTSSFREHLSDVTLNEALCKVASFNTLAALAYHTHYFINVVIPVLKGKPLNASDKVSFDHPSFTSEAEWHEFILKIWIDAEEFAQLVELLPDEKLWETFSDQKYGSYFRNILGIVEHSHYHLGQLVIIKKLVRQKLSI